MKLEHYGDPRLFYQAVEAFLLEREAHHNLHFGILDTLLHNPDHYPTFDLWRVSDEGEIVAVALRTPPHNLLLSEMAVASAFCTPTSRIRPRTASTSDSATAR